MSKNQRQHNNAEDDEQCDDWNFQTGVEIWDDWILNEWMDGNMIEVCGRKLALPPGRVGRQRHWLPKEYRRQRRWEKGQWTPKEEQRCWEKGQWTPKEGQPWCCSERQWTLNTAEDSWRCSGQRQWRLNTRERWIAPKFPQHHAYA